MKLTEYIKGKRYGADANELERQAMEDAFLQEALDGYDSVFSNHLDSIDRINNQIEEQSSRKNHRKMMVYYSVAASFIVLITVGSVVFFNNSDQQMPEMAKNEIIEDEIIPEEVTPVAEVEEILSEDITTKESEDEQAKKEEAKKKRLEQEKAEKEKIQKQEETKKLKEEKDSTKKLKKDDKLMLAQAEEAPAPKEAKAKAMAAAPTKEKKPLYIVNGSPVKDISSIPQDQIESKQVIKDASAEVIYGADGANGVVIIKTKTAKKDSVKESAPFKEKEFKQFFKKKANKTPEENSVKVEFTIGKGKRPYDIKFKKTSSDAAKAEALRVILSSPKWTEESGTKVTMKLKW